jgi:hypothetical protein
MAAKVVFIIGSSVFMNNILIQKIMGAGCWVLGAGCWVLDAGCWMLGAEY